MSLAKIALAILSSLLALTQPGSAHNCSVRPYSSWMADSIISRGQGIAAPGSNDPSILLQMGVFQAALLQLMKPPAVHCGEQNYELFLQQSTESIIGQISNASRDTQFPLDRLSVGRGLLWEFTERGYWYYVYPNWSYLDGMFSLVPFYSLYTTYFDIENTTAINADIIHQLDLLWDHCRDNQTGLLFHGYDATKTAVWANKVTGASPIVWDRALGWYIMALVDFLKLTPVPQQSSQWQHVYNRFVALADAVVKAVDPNTGCWWQVMSFPGRAGNYIESSGSATFTYALYKGVRLGCLGRSATPASTYTGVARRAYQYIVDNFVVHNPNGTLSYNGTVSVCSLNSTANYEYYVSRPLLYDSVLGSASFVLASIEHEMTVSNNTSTN
ncbi:hypothetical protein VTN77DRAFT_6369 [Rasamsonia byssochlamydoides]|uniref:uncharacterized protein n=1 Tax=Rasamsonia byssochlamydoides TaxID=89139 RepID=UPI003743F725